MEIPSTSEFLLQPSPIYYHQPTGSSPNRADRLATDPITAGYRTFHWINRIMARASVMYIFICNKQLVRSLRIQLVHFLANLHHWENLQFELKELKGTCSSRTLL